MKHVGELGFGLLFGIGLALSGMIDTAKVIGFLDVAGVWHPALGFVMGGAIAIGLPIFWWTTRRGRALNGRVCEPPSSVITPRLIGGAAIFGAGWGLVGICPGPALVWLGIDPLAVAPFVLAMAAGMWAADRLSELAAQHQQRTGDQ